jgi:hypothetical protein
MHNDSLANRQTFFGIVQNQIVVFWTKRFGEKCGEVTSVKVSALNQRIFGERNTLVL